MKPYPAILRFSVLLAAAVVFGDRAFCQRAETQRARPASINPATGMPAVPGSKPPAIGPNGLLVPAPFTRSAPPDSGSLSNASVETWSPNVARGSRPDLRAILDEAKRRVAVGDYEDALQRYLWFHNHEPRFGDEHQHGIRLTSALAEWAALGRSYPKAKRALIEIRDKKTSEIVEEGGSLKLFRDVHAINRELEDEDATYALFRTVREQDPKLARQLYPYLVGLLVSKGEHQWCLNQMSQMGGPQRTFDFIRRFFDEDREHQQYWAESHSKTSQRMRTITLPGGRTNSWTPPDLVAWKKKSGEDRFVGGTCQLIEVLLATGHKAEAERIRDQAVAILDDPRLKSAVKDVETRIQNGSLRTQPAPVSGINVATGSTAGARLTKAGVAAAEADLARYLSHYAQSRTSSSNPSLALVLNDWVELGWRYPKARKALVEIRDRDTREFTEGRGDTKLFSELAQINGALQEEEVTYALFKSLEQADPPLAKQCYVYAEELLVRRGEYELCLSCIGDVQQRYKIWLGTYKMQQDLMSRLGGPGDTSARQMKFSDDRFVGDVCRWVEILVGTSHKTEAEKLRDQAFAVLADPRLQSAVSDAEAKVRTVQASLGPLPARVAIRPQVVESSTLFPPKLPAPAASVEHWSPKLQPGTKPDLFAILAAAKDYSAGKHYEESLQHHLWYHNHALEYEPEAQRGVRLGALRDWATLGRKYPKAREALLEIRDRDLHEFAQGRGSVALFKDIAAINEQWGHESTTCRLFKYLKDQQPELATRCYPVAEDALVEKGEYALCLAYIGDGQARFKVHCRNWEQQAKYEQRARQIMQQSQKKMDEYRAQQGQTRPAGPSFIPPPAADNILVGNTRQLIEILVGAGHKADAENIRTQALALVDDPRLKSAVADAEKRMRN